MKHLIVLIAAMALGLGCGKEPNPQTDPAQAKAGSQKQGPREQNEEAASSAKTGPGLAVEAYEIEEGRIKLSEKAVKRLGLKVEKALLLDGAVWVPSLALGDEEGEAFVYVQEPEGWLKRVYVTIGPASGSGTPILSGLAPGTVLVIQGASFVRLAELDLLAGDAVAACCAI